MSCATQSSRVVSVSYGERETLAFTGKGAGAGIMIDSLLGGAGVAIGIAIDEGIAKQINENIFESNPNYHFATRFQKAVAELSLPRALTSPSKNTDAPNTIEIERYGFRTLAGEGDLMSPWLIVNFKCASTIKKIGYPNDFPEPISTSLTQVKTDADVAIMLLEKATKELLANWQQQAIATNHFCLGGN